MANFSPDQLALIGRQEEVSIETSRAHVEQTARTIIWIVVDGDEVFVRSVRGPQGRWYRDLRADPEGILRVGRAAWPVQAIAADDPESVERCSAALRAKYAADPALRSMLRPDVLPATMRLVPR